MAGQFVGNWPSFRVAPSVAFAIAKARPLALTWVQSTVPS
jgi:hypothetical protein